MGFNLRQKLNVKGSDFLYPLPFLILITSELSPILILNSGLKADHPLAGKTLNTL